MQCPDDSINTLYNIIRLVYVVKTTLMSGLIPFRLVGFDVRILLIGCSIYDVIGCGSAVTRAVEHSDVVYGDVTVIAKSYGGLKNNLWVQMGNMTYHLTCKQQRGQREKGSYDGGEGERERERERGRGGEGETKKSKMERGRKGGT